MLKRILRSSTYILNPLQLKYLNASFFGQAAHVENVNEFPEGSCQATEEFGDLISFLICKPLYSKSIKSFLV